MIFDDEVSRPCHVQNGCWAEGWPLHPSMEGITSMTSCHGRRPFPLLNYLLVLTVDPWPYPVLAPPSFPFRWRINTASCIGSFLAALWWVRSYKLEACIPKRHQINNSNANPFKQCKFLSINTILYILFQKSLD